MSQAKAEFAWRTARGLVRARNEDAVAVLPEAGIIVVADGIGGASAGDVASSTAARIIAERLARQPPSPTQPQRVEREIEAAIGEANVVVHEMAVDNPSLAGMGTTVVVGHLGRDHLTYAHVGDSRLYLLRDDTLRQLTSDHSFIQEVVDQGFFATLQDARAYGINENVLTRAVGSTTRVVVATDVIELHAGDLYLFCTDGLTNAVPPLDLCRVLADGDETLAARADELVRLAYAVGGIDNITLALVRVDALGGDEA